MKGFDIFCLMFRYETFKRGKGFLHIYNPTSRWRQLAMRRFWYFVHEYALGANVHVSELVSTASRRMQNFTACSFIVLGIKLVP
jgi:hypothetical protein